MSSKEFVEILMVIDNLEEAEEIELTLRMGKFANAVLHLQDGKKAMEFFKQKTAPLPKIILLDKDLKDISGPELLQQLRSDPRTVEIPVVMFVQREEDKNNINLDKRTSFLLKPFKFDRFMQTVSEIGFYWVIVNKPPGS